MFKLGDKVTIFRQWEKYSDILGVNCIIGRETATSVYVYVPRVGTTRFDKKTGEGTEYHSYMYLRYTSRVHVKKHERNELEKKAKFHYNWAKLSDAELLQIIHMLDNYNERMTK